MNFSFKFELSSDSETQCGDEVPSGRYMNDTVCTPKLNKLY